MLDDSNVIKQRDPKDALGVAANQWTQVQDKAVVHDGDHDGRVIRNILITGMGGSALAGLIAKAGLAPVIGVPLEVVRDYDLPAYVDKHTLVIVSSYSGNTEESLSCLRQAINRGAQIAAITAGGKLAERAESKKIARVLIPAGLQPRMATLVSLKALVSLLANFGVVGRGITSQVAATAEWLHAESAKWLPSVTTDKNYAKQLALLAVGKTPVFYGGTLSGPVAYKWKISWNENAKNVAFWNVYPEANHNEFMGWTSHPVDKPFAVFDLVSSFEHPQILKRFEITDKLLSGKRPKAVTVNLQGTSPLAQQLWGTVLADFVSIYVAILNGVDPTPVDLIEKLKAELA